MGNQQGSIYIKMYYHVFNPYNLTKQYSNQAVKGINSMAKNIIRTIQKKRN